MYRIHFDYKQARFVIQILWLGMLWRTVRIVKEGTLAFDNYDQARQWVKNVGLDKALHERREGDAYTTQLVQR